MARADIRSILYSKDKSPLEFRFDSLIAPPLLSFITIEDIQRLNNIASSVKYASKIELKYKEIDKIMKARGFIKFHSGTNRVVYRPLESNLFITKIAVDRVGLRDSPMEYNNQFLLKPFITKVFEVSPCGTIGSFERVQPFTSREEFASVAEDIFELLNNHIIGKYVLEDIGTKYFMNYGIRTGFGPVLLDFPYVYELDGKKLYCNTKIPELGYRVCGGVIDYDNGFNNLICTKCGKRYLATELKKEGSTIKIISKGDDLNMKVQLCRGNEVIEVNETGTDSIIEPGMEVKQPRTFRNETIINYVETSVGRVILASRPKNKKIKGQDKNFMNDHGYANRTKVPMPKEIEEEMKAQAEEEKAEKEVIFTPDFDVNETKKETEKVEVKSTLVEAETETKNKNYYPQEVLEAMKVPAVDIQQEETEIEDNEIKSSENNNIYINKQGSDMLKIYGLTEADFEEPKDDNIEDKYADIASEYEDSPSYEKIGKSTKQFY